MLEKQTIYMQVEHEFTGTGEVQEALILTPGMVLIPEPHLNFSADTVFAWLLPGYDWVVVQVADMTQYCQRVAKEALAPELMAQTWELKDTMDAVGENKEPLELPAKAVGQVSDFPQLNLTELSIWVPMVFDQAGTPVNVEVAMLIEQAHPISPRPLPKRLALPEQVDDDPEHLDLGIQQPAVYLDTPRYYELTADQPMMTLSHPKQVLTVSAHTKVTLLTSQPPRDAYPVRGYWVFAAMWQTALFVPEAALVMHAKPLSAKQYRALPDAIPQYWQIVRPYQWAKPHLQAPTDNVLPISAILALQLSPGQTDYAVTKAKWDRITEWIDVDVAELTTHAQPITALTYQRVLHQKLLRHINLFHPDPHVLIARINDLAEQSVAETIDLPNEWLPVAEAAALKPGFYAVTMGNTGAPGLLNVRRAVGDNIHEWRMQPQAAPLRLLLMPGDQVQGVDIAQLHLEPLQPSGMLIGRGNYIVGRDFPPGRYHLNGDGQGDWAISVYDDATSYAQALRMPSAAAINAVNPRAQQMLGQAFNFEQFANAPVEFHLGEVLTADYMQLMGGSNDLQLKLELIVD
ncbi:hypothetical protein ACFQ5J_11250 [Lacticaseibacillus baoqingensis]|uniref:Uncharacterized protein n=1 Tax=Lacticaseibacillus baoqingensis TaxID=2486013 RepID=A0ABW4E9A9_9LACO|nr:hypothetical protein [Lacticaseibacillus baoqingensis]